MAKVARFVLTPHHRIVTFTPDHGMIPFKKSLNTKGNYVLGEWSVVVLCLLFKKKKKKEYFSFLQPLDK